MNLLDLKQSVDDAVISAKEYGQSPNEIIVSLQIEPEEGDAICAIKQIALHYDNDGHASGCVLVGFI